MRLVCGFVLVSFQGYYHLTLAILTVYCAVLCGGEQWEVFIDHRHKLIGCWLVAKNLVIQALLLVCYVVHMKCSKPTPNSLSEHLWVCTASALDTLCHFNWSVL